MKVKNWEQFQHYRKGKNAINPTWIRLYRKLLDDKEWHVLGGEEAKTLVMIWLVASEDEGNLPDLPTLAFRLRLTEQRLTAILGKLEHFLGQSYADTRVDKIREDKIIDKENPRTILGSVLDEEHAQAVIEHRKALKKPLSLRAAKLLAENFKTQQNPNQAADTMIERGWVGFNPEWVSPAGKQAKRNGNGWHIPHGTKEYAAWRKYAHETQNGDLIYALPDRDGHTAYMVDRWPPRG